MQSTRIADVLLRLKCAYHFVDEEQPVEKSKDVKREKEENDKSLPSGSDIALREVYVSHSLINHSSAIPSKPSLQRPSPPPDAC